MPASTQVSLSPAGDMYSSFYRSSPTIIATVVALGSSRSASGAQKMTYADSELEKISKEIVNELGNEEG